MLLLASVGALASAVVLGSRLNGNVCELIEDSHYGILHDDVSESLLRSHASTLAYY